MNYLVCCKTFKQLFDKTLGNWKTYLVDFALKDNTNPICSKTNPLSNARKKIS